MIIVDYRCPACETTTEALVTAPVPPMRLCPGCGGDAHRKFGLAGLGGRAAAPASGSANCTDNPDVPGLCHVGSAAKRSLVARYRGDTETFAAEQHRQRRQFERAGPPDPSTVFAHTHPTQGTTQKS